MAIDNKNTVPNAPSKGNVPALRFPEFTEEWTAETIDELFELRNGYTPSKNNLNFWNNGTIPWFRMEDIRLNGGVLKDAIQHITPEAVKGSGLFEPYSIILATTATIGEHAMLIADSLANQRFTNFKIRKSLTYKYNPYYLYYYFFKIDKWCLKNTNAGGLLSVDIPSLKRQKLYSPSVEEQNKIAKLLRLIDDRISIQSRIIEKYETLIKGIIETVISLQKPNTFIKDCLECSSSILQESQVAEYGACPVYGATGITGYTEAADVNGESILIIKDGSGVGTVKYVTGEYSYIGTLNRLIAKDGYYLKYIYFALQGFSFEPYKTGMAIPHIYFKDYGKAKIYCPSYKLQYTISQQLTCIESKIDVEKRMLFDLLQQKSYLLSHMFI